MQELCMVVADELENKYRERLNTCPKANVLKEYLDSHKFSKAAIVVPKAYYADLLRMEYPEYFADEAMICVTANRFDSRKNTMRFFCVSEK